MFRHQGKTRTLRHNKQIASLLSFVAGIVNVAGFLSVQRLTTNVTGHFAFFVDEVFRLHFLESFIYFIYILFFFLGSFASNLLIESMKLRNSRHVFVIPILIESAILFAMALFGHGLLQNAPDVIACGLLFAMGLQNSLVTRISDAMVRTTHLTGLFTDLGIEISQLFFYKAEAHRTKLITTIKLRLRIIVWFFTGGIAGGILYSYLALYALLVPATLLIAGLLYDSIRISIRLRLLYWRGRGGYRSDKP